MGAWGASLYANDCTCDVRDTYTYFLQEQMSNEEAYQKTIEKCHEYIGDEDEPLLWYALADTQWKVGRLMPEVKKKALEWIEKGGGLVLWEESKNGGRGWKKTLEKLKSKLESPMPPEKVIRKPEEFVRNPWEVGDMYAYQFHTDIAKERGLFGKYIVFQKIGNTEDCDWILSTVKVFDRVFDDLPTLEDLEGVRDLPLIYPHSAVSPQNKKEYIPSFKCYLKAYMIYEKKSHYPEKYFTFIGNKFVPDRYYAGNEITYFFWEKDRMDDWLSGYYLRWKDIEY